MNDDDNPEVVEDNDVAQLDSALAGKTQEQIDAESLEAKRPVDDTPQEDARPGDDADDDVAPNLPNTLTEEQRKQRNKDWRAQQKQRRKEQQDQTARELEMLRANNAELHNRLSTIENRSTGTELANLNGRITKAGTDYVWYKDQIAVQSAAGNHAGVAEATDKMYQAAREHDHFSNIKKGWEQNQRRGATPAADPNLMRLANKWMGDNAWYNPASGDEDSLIVLAIDKALVNKNYNPASPEYWDEMNRRVAKMLPHRAKQGYTPPNSGGGPRPPVGGGGNNGGGGPVKDGFQLSAARVEAMREAGLWDDPKKRAAQIAQYKKYDAQHAQGA